MSRVSDIEKEVNQIQTVHDLTDVFEDLASARVAKIKNKTEMSNKFFQLLWERYSSIRIDPGTRITNRGSDDTDARQVFVVIAAEAGLSGDIDHRLIETVQDVYDPSTTDIVVLGSHGATQLTQQGIPYIRFFQIPQIDEYIDVSPVIDTVMPYGKIVIYYEEYVSLGVQNIRSIDLFSHIRTMTEGLDDSLITTKDTIFEPSLDEIAREMEHTMMRLAFGQTTLIIQVLAF